MSELFIDGTLIDVALAALLVELVILMTLARRGRGSLRPLDVVGQLLAGGLLLLALRCALTGSDGGWVVVLLAASLPAHLYDLSRRMGIAR